MLSPAWLGKMKWSRWRCAHLTPYFPPFPQISSCEHEQLILSFSIIVQDCLVPGSGPEVALAPRRESPSNNTCTEYNLHHHLHTSTNPTQPPISPAPCQVKPQSHINVSWVAPKAPLPSLHCLHGDHSVTEACPQRLVLHNGNIAWTWWWILSQRPPFYHQWTLSQNAPGLNLPSPLVNHRSAKPYSHDPWPPHAPAPGPLKPILLWPWTHILPSSKLLP